MLRHLLICCVAMHVLLNVVLYSCLKTAKYTSSWFLLNVARETFVGKALSESVQFT